MNLVSLLLSIACESYGALSLEGTVKFTQNRNNQCGI